MGAGVVRCETAGWGLERRPSEAGRMLSPSPPPPTLADTRDSHQTLVQGSLPRRRHRRNLCHTSRARHVGSARKEAGRQPAPLGFRNSAPGSMTRRSTPVPLHPSPEHRISERVLRHLTGICDWLCPLRSTPP